MVPFGGYQIRPENALQRAQELLEVGKKLDALETLHEVIKSRKLNRAGWTKSHELIMLKHLELCVELRKPHLAKDGLFQYRNMVQQINVKSLENVILFLLTQAETKAETARQESQDLVEEVVDDLDQAESPESLLLASVSRTDAQDRADRTVLSPWLRFLWDSYRQCLELLRNNAQVEQLYHKVARQAFDFCLKYSRRAEFRKLCDNLRGHLNQLQKSQHLSYAVKLNNIETLMMQQDTRLKQLDIAIQMELWQEAFKSAEDVHNLMTFSKERIAKTMVKGQALANYYEKLALVFWKAGDKLHHAAALFRLFQHTKDMKKSFTNQENSHHATRVLLATLSIGPGAGVASDLCRYLDMEETMTENQRRLAQLLELSAPPTRTSLLRELNRSNVLQAAAAPAQQLYKLVDTIGSPLRLASQIETELNNVNNLDKEDYSRYIHSLRWVSALRILHQISEVYETISMSRLQSIIPFYGTNTLQKLLVHAGKRGYVRMRIDHRAGCIQFAHEESVSQADEDTQMRMVDESLPGESMKVCLLNLYKTMEDITVGLTADQKKKDIQTNLNRSKLIYRHHHNDDYVKILERKRIIELFKESCEKKREERQRIEELTAAQLAEQHRICEQRRLMEEEREFQIQKEKNQKDEMQKKIVQDKLEKLTKTEIGRQVLSAFDESEIESLSTEALFQKQIEKYNTIKKEQASQLKKQEKKWDHLVRALHEEEVLLREHEYSKWKDTDVVFWDKYEKDRVAKAKEDQKQAVETYDRLERVREDAATFLADVKKSRAESFAARTEAWKKKLADTKAHRIQELKNKKKEMKRQEWLEERRLAAEAKQKEVERRDYEKDADRHGRQGFGRGERGAKEDEEQRADGDADWRRGAVAQSVSSTQDVRKQPSRADESGPWARGQALEGGPPSRGGPERAEGPSAADTADNWRMGRQAESAPVVAAATTNTYRPPGARPPGPPGPPPSDQGVWGRAQPVAPQQPQERDNSWRRDAPPAEERAWRQPPQPQAEPVASPRQGYVPGSMRAPGGRQEERPYYPPAEQHPEMDYQPRYPPQAGRFDSLRAEVDPSYPSEPQEEEGFQTVHSSRRGVGRPSQGQEGPPQHYAENRMFDPPRHEQGERYGPPRGQAAGFDQYNRFEGQHEQYDRSAPRGYQGEGYGQQRQPQRDEKWGPSARNPTSEPEQQSWRTKPQQPQQRRDDRGGGASDTRSWRN